MMAFARCIGTDASCGAEAGVMWGYHKHSQHLQEHAAALHVVEVCN